MVSLFVKQISQLPKYSELPHFDIKVTGPLEYSLTVLPKGHGTKIPCSQDSDPNFKSRMATIAYTRTLTKTELAIRLPNLQSLSNRDLLYHINELNNDSEVCKWSQEFLTNCIIVLTDFSFRKNFKNQTEPSELLKALVKEKYT